MNKALALEVAREKNLSPEKVYEICKSFHDGIRFLMLEPENCKSGIMIHDFLTLNFKELKLKDSIEKDGTGDPVIKQKIVDNLKTYGRTNRNDITQKQASKEINNE